MLIEEYQNLVISEPDFGNLAEKREYGDFVTVNFATTPINDLEDIRFVIEEQCENSLNEIKKLRGETPVAIYFYSQPISKKNDTILLGWKAWTSERRGLKQ